MDFANITNNPDLTDDLKEYIQKLLEEKEESQNKEKELRHLLQETQEKTQALQEKIYRCEDKVRLKWDETNLGIAEVDSQKENLGKFLCVNPALCEMLKYSQEELINLSSVEITHLDDREEYERILHKLLSGNKNSLVYEKRYLRKDGENLWVKLKVIVAYRDENKKNKYLLYFIENIHKHKSLEDQLRQAVKMEAIGQLAGGVAHDFNNLLTVITGHSAIMMTKMKGKSPFYRNAEEVNKAADRAAKLTRQLLTFSRKQVLEPKIFDLCEVVLDIDRLLRRMIGEDIELIFRPTKNSFIKADQGQVEQVIMNLAVNARDAMQEGGKFFIEIINLHLDDDSVHQHPGLAPGAYALLKASDTGMGMTKKTKKRIFEPFFTTKIKGKGTGLGLSTVYGIVQQSDGHINVDSEEGKGTIFKIYFPLIQDKIKKEKSSKNIKAKNGVGKVLVVEDEDGTRKLVMETLEIHGYTVMSASNPDDAIQICQEHPDKIDLFITDVILPRMNGPELYHKVKDLQPKMKLLYMSGYDLDMVIKKDSLDKNVTLLQKPFSPLKLILTVSKILT